MLLIFYLVSQFQQSLPFCWLLYCPAAAHRSPCFVNSAHPKILTMKWRSIYVNWLQILILLERSSGTEWRKSVLMSCFIPNLAWWSDWTIRGSLINSSVAATFYWFGIDRVINARFNTTYRETVWGLGGMGLLLDHQTFLGLGVCFTPWGCMFTAQCWGLD